ncbi:DUF2690 domain-containing protein [Streptomyces sp. NPDC054796]
MNGWKALPDTLEPDVRRLVEELRRTKDTLGISLAELARSTAYSKSSWERYLNGGQLPPLQAVQALAARPDVEAARLLALWELAEAAWSGRGRALASGGPDEARQEPGPAGEEPSPAGAGPVGGTGARGRPSRNRLLLAALAVGVVVTAAGVIVGVSTGDDEGGAQRAAGGATSTEEPVKGVKAKCHGSTCDGKDPVDKGCGGDAWTSAAEQPEKSYVEVRYSSVCRAAWARIKSAHPGDRIELVREDGRTYDETVPDDANLAAFTFMLGAPAPQDVKACWELKSGDKGCTDFGGSTPLPEASPVPS